MDIRIGLHTMQRALERGMSEDEFTDVIENGFQIAAKRKHLGKARIYTYDRERLGKYYAQKRVEVFYTAETNVIVAVTVYVFYGQCEDESASIVRWPTGSAVPAPR